MVFEIVASKFVLAALNIVVGILVLVFPGFLRVIVGAYLILSGIIMLF